MDPMRPAKLEVRGKITENKQVNERSVHPVKIQQHVVGPAFISAQSEEMENLHDKPVRKEKEDRCKKTMRCFVNCTCAT